MASKGLEPVTFRLTAQEKARFRIQCIQAGTSMQAVLADFVKARLRKVRR